LALAEQHHCEGLKEACFKVVMESETLQVKVNQAVHRALSNPSGVLLNTLQKLIKRMVDELIDQRVHLWRQIEEKQQYQLGDKHTNMCMMSYINNIGQKKLKDIYMKKIGPIELQN
jgi:hypothetical protein